MPICFICSIQRSGYSFACSTSCTPGLTSRSTKSRTVWIRKVSSSLSWATDSDYRRLDGGSRSVHRGPVADRGGELLRRIGLDEKAGPLDNHGPMVREFRFQPLAFRG